MCGVLPVSPAAEFGLTTDHTEDTKATRMEKCPHGPESSWTALAKRSGDSALDAVMPGKSGVALRLPLQSKSFVKLFRGLRVFRG